MKPLSAGQRAANTVHARVRATGERANATLKNWRVPRKIRSSPHGATSLVIAIQTLILAGRFTRMTSVQCPLKSARINQAWIAAAIACDLLVWLRLLCLTSPLSQAEPNTVRYRILHTSAQIIRGQR